MAPVAQWAFLQAAWSMYGIGSIHALVILFDEDFSEVF